MTPGAAAPLPMPGPAFAISAKGRGPSPAASLYAHVAAAPVVKPKPALTELALRRRVAVTPKRKTAAGTMRTNALPAPAVRFAPPKKLAAAVKGRALRVSQSTGFRLPESKLRVAGAPPVLIAIMRWPEAVPLNAAASSAFGKRACAIESTPPDMRYPGAPAAVFQGNFRWPGAMRLALRSANAATAERPGSVRFGSEERR